MTIGFIVLVKWEAVVDTQQQPFITVRKRAQPRSIEASLRYSLAEPCIIFNPPSKGAEEEEEILIIKGYGNPPSKNKP